MSNTYTDNLITAIENEEKKLKIKNGYYIGARLYYPVSNKHKRLYKLHIYHLRAEYGFKRKKKLSKVYR